MILFFNAQAAVAMRAPEPGRPETTMLHLLRKLNDGCRVNSNEDSRSRSGDLRRRLTIAQAHFKPFFSQQDIEKFCINKGWTLIVVTSNIYSDTEVCLFYVVCCENFIFRWRQISPWPLSPGREYLLHRQKGAQTKDLLEKEKLTKMEGWENWDVLKKVKIWQ